MRLFLLTQLIQYQILVIVQRFNIPVSSEEANLWIFIPIITPERFLSYTSSIGLFFMVSISEK